MMQTYVQKNWLITGAGRGIGAAISKYVLEQGHQVIATVRNAQKASKILGKSPNLHLIELDITDDSQVQSAIEDVLKQFSTIDVLVNNAGYGLIGYFEEFSEQQIREQFETNVFGTFHVTRAVLPAMRRQREGKIVVISSTSGIRAVNGGSIYSASKFALEGWLEGMRIDLAPFGIQCMLVEPGAFRTDFSNEKTSLRFSEQSIADYDEVRANLFKNQRALDKTQPGDPDKLAKVLYDVLNEATPPFRLVAGKAAVMAAENHLKQRCLEVDAWRQQSQSTDF